MNKNKLFYYSNYIGLTLDIISSIIAFFITLSLCIYTKGYYFFVPILIILLLNILVKSLNILYLLTKTQKPKIAEKIAKISKILSFEGIVFYFFGTMLLGYILTYWFENHSNTNLILIILTIILFSSGIFLDIRKKK